MIELINKNSVGAIYINRGGNEIPNRKNNTHQVLKVRVHAKHKWDQNILVWPKHREEEKDDETL